MKKIKKWSWILIALFILSGCNDNDSDNEEIEFTGRWRLTEINFTSNVSAWHKTTYADDKEVFGWAPYMFESLMGYELSNKEYTDANTQKKGNEAKVVLNSSFGSSSKVYWIWNETNDGKGFEVSQLNTKMPPYDFSVTNVTNVRERKSGGKRVIEFTATVNSLDQEKYDVNTMWMLRPTLKAEAQFVVESVADSYQFGEADVPAILLNGKTLTLPTLEAQ